jgi:gliding motility-associated-like protein
MRILNHISVITLLLIAMLTHPTLVEGAEITFQNSSLKVLSETPDRNTGLDKIYIAYTIKDLTATFTLSSGNAYGVKWYRYSNLGGGYAEEVASTADGNTSTLSHLEGDMGYIVENGTDRYYFWVVDYSAHPLSVTSISSAYEQECESTVLLLQGYGDAIHYYTISGQQRTLSRDITIDYYNLEWDSQQQYWTQVAQQRLLESIAESVTLSPAVYCQTTFLLTADKFLHQWGLEQQIESPTFYPNAVAVETDAVGDNEEDSDTASNVIGTNTSGLGGSAPAAISFHAFITDAVAHSEWQFSSDADFETLLNRFNQQDLDYTFNEEGTFYARFIGSNSDGSCEAIGETYTITIGSSELKCPNAFSPGTSEGVNDEWKVAYRSIIEFKCWIFDRYGTQLFYFDDPTQGWDGTYKGKLVNPGVYFYVIEAKGADGKNYKKSGDINIVRYTGAKASTSSSTSN